MYKERERGKSSRNRLLQEGKKKQLVIGEGHKVMKLKKEMPRQIKFTKKEYMID